MIRFALTCKNDHRFDSWFASGDAFDRLAAAGHLSCSVCGSPSVTKAPMAPAIGVSRASDTPAEAQAPAPQSGAVALPDPELAARLQALRAHIEANSTHVGRDFVRQAREMHLGERPERPIHGEARVEDASALLDEGIPVMPLPFLSPPRRTN